MTYLLSLLSSIRLSLLGLLSDLLRGNSLLFLLGSGF
jgi:hypothetical protein